MSDSDHGARPEKGQLSPEDIAEFKRRASQLGSRIDSVQAEKQAEILPYHDGCKLCSLGPCGSPSAFRGRIPRCYPEGIA